MTEQERANRVIRLIVLLAAAGLLLLLVWNIIDLFAEDWIGALVLVILLAAWELIDFRRARRRGLPYP